MNKLIVSERFYSIQGEGVTMGVPAVFLRLGGCNLLCPWCDSIEVWKKGHATEFENVLPSDYVRRLRQGAHLIITGGEPLLHDSSIVSYLQWFVNNYKFTPVIEVETNGTIVPSTQLLFYVQQWNCSPKLANSGEPVSKRLNELALMTLAKRNTTCFKFVVSNEDDVLEVINEYGSWLEPQQFVLMPLGDSLELLNLVRQTVVELCIKYGMRYSDRLHIATWNQKTGV